MPAGLTATGQGQQQKRKKKKEDKKKDESGDDSEDDSGDSQDSGTTSTDSEDGGGSADGTGVDGAAMEFNADAALAQLLSGAFGSVWQRGSSEL